MVSMTTRHKMSVSWEESEALDYVTIAKAGGRKDLLAHTENVRDLHTEVHTVQPSVDWFAHPTPPPPPLNTSYESAIAKSWMQWSPLPKLAQQDAPNKAHHHRTRSDPVKLPKLDGVDFSRLLSLDYQREWLEDRANKQAEERRKARLKRAAQKQKLREHTIKARKILGVDTQTQEKTRFILKRFAEVPARVKLPPID